ncbi:MAG: response regulator [Candidatus Omnitrophica bacterium]|nr:response regulator [Candidatus Omnitrophota bacterium]
MAPKTILLVDDDRTFTTLIETKLKGENYNVVVARDGNEGLTAAKEQKPSLIILDVLMPGLTGYEFCKKISDEEELKKIPMLVISSKKSMQDFFPDWAIQGFIHKPFKPEELLEKVQEALKNVPDTAEPEAVEKPAEAAKKEEKKEEKKEAPAAQAPKEAAPAPAAPAPAAAAPAPPAPAETKGGPIRVMFIGNEDFVNKKIKTALDAAGYASVPSLGLDDAVEDADKVKPHFILCKFHENPEVIDANAAFKKFQELPATKKALFAVFCPKTLSGEVAKSFKPAQIVTYVKTEDLIQNLITFLKSQKVGAKAA